MKDQDGYVQSSQEKLVQLMFSRIDRDEEKELEREFWTPLSFLVEGELKSSCTPLSRDEQVDDDNWGVSLKSMSKCGMD